MYVKRLPAVLYSSALRIDEMRISFTWLTFYALVLSSWVGLLALSIFNSTLHGLHADKFPSLTVILSQHPHHAGFLTLLCMWGAMSAAMMLPSFVPVLQTYEDIRRSAGKPPSGAVALTLGYLLIWMLYSLLASWIQFALHASNFPFVESVRTSWISAFALLAAAGAYQLSPLKQACLTKCRNPLIFFVAKGSFNFQENLLIGLRIGVWCLGCCWLLMAISLVSGMMTLIWMGLATLLITIEKLPDLGRYFSEPMAILLIGGSIWVFVVNVF